MKIANFPRFGEKALNLDIYENLSMSANVDQHNFLSLDKSYEDCYLCVILCWSTLAQVFVCPKNMSKIGQNTLFQQIPVNA